MLKKKCVCDKTQNRFAEKLERLFYFHLISLDSLLID